MATTFPAQIQYFDDMLDITSDDLQLVAKYQEAMKSNDFASAKQILTQIPNYNKKIVQSSYFNDINDTLVAVQEYFATRYSPAYIVSEIKPTKQEIGDFWFQVIA